MLCNTVKQVYFLRDIYFPKNDYFGYSCFLILPAHVCHTYQYEWYKITFFNFTLLKTH